MRCNVRPEDLVRDGQGGERDVVQVFALLRRDDQERESDGRQEGLEQRPAGPELLQLIPDQPGDFSKIAASCSGASAFAWSSRYMLRPVMRLASVRARSASCNSVT